MRRRFTYFVIAALVLVAAGASSTLAAGGGNLTYMFKGRLLTDAGNSSSLYDDVNGGDKPALRKLLGQSDNQYFAVGSGTQYLRWSHGVPTVVAEANLVAGDIVSVRVRAAHGASLRSEEHTSELQSRRDLVCRLLLEKKNKQPED